MPCIALQRHDDVAGSWFFAPYNAERTYWFDPEQFGGKWRPETNYARYGYWLSGDPTNPAIHVYAMRGEDGSYVSREGPVDETVHATNSANLYLGTVMGEPLQATYTGAAAGVSVRQAGPNLESGHFDAVVTLTAKFGPEPHLGGVVDYFRGHGTSAGWTVALPDTPINAAGTASPRLWQ